MLGEQDQDSSAAVVMEEAIIFKNQAPGGSELLRLFSKSTEKDTQERMLAEMENIERLIKEIPPQVKYTLYMCTFPFIFPGCGSSRCRPSNHLSPPSQYSS